MPGRQFGVTCKADPVCQRRLILLGRKIRGNRLAKTILHLAEAVNKKPHHIEGGVVSILRIVLEVQIAGVDSQIDVDVRAVVWCKPILQGDREE